MNSHPLAPVSPALAFSDDLLNKLSDTKDFPDRDQEPAFHTPVPCGLGVSSQATPLASHSLGQQGTGG